MNINKCHEAEWHKEDLYEGSVFGYRFFSSKINENKVRLPDGKEWWALHFESLIPHKEVIYKYVSCGQFLLPVSN